jgi:cellulose synthase/poly-beta-1,6-N-acetylglucosamine synthase-like glycosyltransferase
MLEIVFWASLSLILWSYCGYPAYLWIKSLILVGKDMPSQDRFPFISIMIAAYNEEKCIIEKVQNCFEFDYPKDRLEIIVASDGSTDNTLGALQRFSARDNIHILDLPRGGKAKSINAMFGLARGEIAILTDANVMLANNA